MRYICIWLIRLYQRYLSPLKGHPTCRFTPSCSAYAVEAYLKRGFIVGSILTAWRILRCNPMCAGGYDPVPFRGLSNREQREEYQKKIRSGYYQDFYGYTGRDRKPGDGYYEDYYGVNTREENTEGEIPAANEEEKNE